MRCPRRAGSETDWLTETHVATAYHQRFQAAADRQERMREVQQDLVAEECNRDRPHPVVTLVPEVPGEMPINQRSFVAHKEAPSAARPLLGLSHQPFVQVSVGRRKLRLGRPSPAARRDLAYLHDDGAGVWARPIDTRVYTVDDDARVRVVDAVTARPAWICFRSGRRSLEWPYLGAGYSSSTLSNAPCREIDVMSR